MVFLGINNDLFVYNCIFNSITNPIAYTPTLTCVNKAILWPGIKSIFPIDELRMKHYVTLLRGRGFQVRQTFPLFQVFGTCYAALCNGRRLISFNCCGVLAFSTKYTIDPSIFVLHQAHIIDITIWLLVRRHIDWIIPKPESVTPTITFSNCKK